MARPEKVGGRRRDPRQARRGRRRRAHRVPRPDGRRARRAARRRCARPAPSTRSSRTPWPAGRSRRPGSTSCVPTARGPGRDRLRAAATRCVAAKALRDFARTNPTLVVKGGLLGDRGAHARPTSRRWPTSRPARCCSPGSPAGSRRRWSRRPACSRPSPATSPTASRRSIDQRVAGGEAPPSAEAPGRAEARRGRSRAAAAAEAPAEDAEPASRRGRSRSRGRRAPRRPTEPASRDPDRDRDRSNRGEQQPWQP